MAPFCGRCLVAGSIRRRKEEVKDIEIVATPIMETAYVQEGLFSEEVTVNLLHRWATTQLIISWIKPGVSQIVPWKIKPEGKYWRGLLPSGIKLDLFIADYTNFGLIYAIRTGCADFSSALLAHANTRSRYQTETRWYEDRPELKKRGESGYLVAKANGERVATPEERDVFELLGLEYIEPHERVAWDSLRVRRL